MNKRHNIGQKFVHVDVPQFVVQISNIKIYNYNVKYYFIDLNSSMKNSEYALEEFNFYKAFYKLGNNHNLMWIQLNA